jgi:hypothetical protein
MKTLNDYIAIAQDMADNDYHINLGVDRKVNVKETIDSATIAIYCYTLNGKYKGAYKCGSYNKNNCEYKPGYDVDLDNKLVR